MKLNVEIRNNVALVVLEGALDAQTCGTLKQALSSAIQDGYQDIVLDLSGVNFMDSSGLGTIVGAFKQVRVGRGDVRVAGLQPNVKKVFSLTRLDRVFSIFETADQALKGAA